MKERGIIFSAPMVRALLEGRKSQTRRLVKPGRGQERWLSAEAISKVARWAPSKDDWWTMAVGPESRIAHCGHEMDGGHIGSVRCPYGQPGDRLWVRETFGVLTGAGHRYVYRADGEEPEQAFYPHETIPDMRWAPSIHMPRRASRLTLEITDVRVERLNGISARDSVLEGIEVGEVAGAAVWRDYALGEHHDPFEWFGSARRSFQSLWESIHGAGSWAANPWVWAISFRRVS